ncbi:MAG: hypothetical protein CSA55_04490 [Ilumatobacter coccineus]|uniref:DUF6576 domain-containing protein n=1 Tax=Ilumatobacter coccineus TaxID=467094 RepID=A0A2G6KAD1_9ACTN|nr:MAG: hypothetical protein CSA55_04490 [Ilumatobacter coccineus]
MRDRADTRYRGVVARGSLFNAPRNGWMRIGNFDLTTTSAITIASVISMVLWAINPPWITPLRFSPLIVRNLGHYWSVVTWPIANQPGFFAIFSLVFFWFVGHAVEEMVGRRRFVILVAAITIIPAVIITPLPATGFPAAPSDGLTYVSVVLFALFTVEHPRLMFFGGIPAWVLAALFLGLDLLQLIGLRYWGSVLHLITMLALGLIMVRRWGFLSQLNAVLGRRPSPKTRRRSSAQPTVVTGPWVSPAETAAAHTELDALLDKISANGLDSLTEAEKRRLNELSKKMR